MDGIFQLQLFSVPLFEESLRTGCVLANGCGLPRVITAAGVNLVQAGPALQDTPSGFLRLIFIATSQAFLCLGLDTIIPSRNQQTNTVWSDTSRLCCFLHDTGNVLHEDPGWWVFVVDPLVRGVGDFTGLVDQHPVVGTHSRIDHTNIGSDQGNL